MNGCGMADLQAIMDYEIPHNKPTTSTSNHMDFVDSGFVSQHCKEVMCMCSGLPVCAQNKTTILWLLCHSALLHLQVAYKL